MIADAQLAATQSAEHGNAQITLMNAGGIRADLHVPNGGGEIAYGQLFNTQPFGNNLIIKSFSGAQLHVLLEHQFKQKPDNSGRPRILLPSSGFTYAYDLRKPAGSRISAMRLHGKPLATKEIYRVTMNSYLANGGDQFSKFNQGSNISEGKIDVDALEDYLQKRSPINPPATNRVARIN